MPSPGFSLASLAADTNYTLSFRTTPGLELGQAEQELLSAKLSGLRLEIPKRVGDTGTLYGSVTAGDVAELLEKKGFTIDRRRIDLEGGIKSLGDHQVRVELHPEVVAEVTVSVVAAE